MEAKNNGVWRYTKRLSINEIGDSVGGQDQD